MADQLFDLISSLNRNEKGYVKKHAQQHVVGKHNNYIVLFDLIEGQEEYDEAAIKQHVQKVLKDEKFHKNFAVVKNYLYNYLLRTLTNYHAQNSYNAKASTSLHTIQILLDKAQHRQAGKLIAKTIKFATRSENYTLLLEVLKLKVVHLEATMENELIDATYAEIFETEEVLTNLNRYRYLHHQMYTIAMRLGTESLDDLVKETKAFLKQRLLRNEDAALCNEARIRFHEIHLLACFITDDHEAGYAHSSRSYEISRNTPYYKEEKRENYVSNMNNLLMFCNATDRLNRVDELLAELKGMITKDPNSKLNIKIFAAYGIQETNLFIITKEFERIQDEIDDLNMGLELFDEQLLIVQRYIIIMNISICYFAIGDFRTSLAWINRILNGPMPESRHDIVSFAHVLSAITHYELGNHDLLDYLSASAKRFFKKLSENTMLHEQVLDLLKELSVCTTHLDRHQLLKEFSALHSKAPDAIHSVYSSFDVLAWVRAKEKGTEYAHALN